MSRHSKAYSLTLSLLSLLSLWLEIDVLELRRFFVRFYDHFLVYLIRQLIKVMLFSYRWLKKLEPRLYDLIKPPAPEDSSDDSGQPSSPSDRSSISSVASVT